MRDHSCYPHSCSRSLFSIVPLSIKLFSLLSLFLLSHIIVHVFINIYFPPNLLSQFMKYIIHGVTYEYQMGQGEARARRQEVSVNLNMVCSWKNTRREKKSKRYRSTNKVFLELETCTAPPCLTHSILSTSPSFSNSSRMGSPSYMAPAPRAVPRHRRSD